MRSHFISASFAVAVAFFGCLEFALAGNSPLDFSYRITGAAEIRPLLVFNDGVDTFIQPQDPAEKGLVVNGAAPVRQGPYFVVRGLAQEITLSKGGKTGGVRISYSSQQAPIKPTQTAGSIVAQAAVAAQGPQAHGNSPKPGAQSVATPSRSESGAPVAPNAQIAESKAAANNPSAIQAKQTASEENRKSEPVPQQCKPKREMRESAFVATFKSGTNTLSGATKDEFKKFIGDISAISSVEIITEGAEKSAGQKRAETIKSVLLASGIDAEKIHASVREPSGIGSEIHIHRTIEIPCGANVVKVPSRKSNVTIVWNQDARGLAERIAADLKLKFSTVGKERPVPVQISIIDVPFDDAMQEFGLVMDENADLILRNNELILNFKEKQ